MKNDLGDAFKYFALLLLLLLIFVPTYSLSQDRGGDDKGGEGDGREPEGGGTGGTSGGSSGSGGGGGSSSGGGGGGRSETRERTRVQILIDQFLEDVFDIPSEFTRRPQTRVLVDPNAKHSCEVKKFYVNLSRNNRVFNLIELNTASNRGKATYTLEMIDLPVGAFAFFNENGGQLISTNDRSLDFEVRKIGSLAEGKHQMVLVFTANYDIGEPSVVTCEYNIINN